MRTDRDYFIVDIITKKVWTGDSWHDDPRLAVLFTYEDDAKTEIGTHLELCDKTTVTACPREVTYYGI